MTGSIITFEKLVASGALAVGDGYRAKNEELGKGGPIFLRSAYLQASGFNLSDPECFSSDFTTADFGPKVSQVGDVVVTTKGNSTGRIGVIRAKEAGAVYSPHLSYWRSLQPKTIDQRFLFYWALGQEFREQMAGMAGSTDMAPYLSLRDQLRLRVTLPDTEVQKSIGQILGALDDKIELNRRMNETLEAMARAIFKDWFVDFGPTRAKMSGSKPYLAPDLWSLFPDKLGENGLPEGWEQVTLADVSSRIAMGPFGSDITTENFVEAGVPVIRGGNLKAGFIDDGFVFVTEEKADQLRNANASAGTIVLTHRGTLGQVGVIPTSAQFKRYVVSQSQMLLEADTAQVSSRFLFEFLRSPEGMRQLLANTSQTGVPAISRPTTSLKQLRLPRSGKPVVDAFDQSAGTLATKADANSLENQTLAALRDLLLPKLMSGELRVKDAEQKVEAAT